MTNQLGTPADRILEKLRLSKRATSEAESLKSEASEEAKSVKLTIEGLVVAVTVYECGDPPRLCFCRSDANDTYAAGVVDMPLSEAKRLTGWLVKHVGLQQGVIDKIVTEAKRKPAESTGEKGKD